MKKTILIFSFIFLMTFFWITPVFADYSQNLDGCIEKLSKSSSAYCYIDINYDAGNGSFILGVGVYREPSKKQIENLAKQRYENTLKSNSEEYVPPFWEKNKVWEEPGPDTMKLIITQAADVQKRSGYIHNFSTDVFLTQGLCGIDLAGSATKRSEKGQYVDGNLEGLRKESIAYMEKVSDDLNKVCEKDKLIPVQSLLDEPPKESDFQQIPQSDFKKVYPVGTDSASLKTATQSSGLAFIGKIGNEGKLLVELPNGETVTLTDDRTGAEVWEARQIISQNNATLLNVRPEYHIYEVDCHIQIAQNLRDMETLARLGEVRKASHWDLGDRTETVGDCSDLDIDGLLRIFVQKGPAVINVASNNVLADQDSDFGILNDAKSGRSIIEVYNGSLVVKSKTGESKTISTVYGSEIKRIEVNKNGVMTEKTAIPQSQWETFLASQEQKKKTPKDTVLPIIGTIAVLAIGTVTFFLYRKGKGKLIPLYGTLSQKVSGLMKKTSKSSDEEKTD